MDDQNNKIKIFCIEDTHRKAFPPFPVYTRNSFIFCQDMSCDYIIVVAVRIISSSTLNFYLRMAGTAIKTTLSAHRKIVRFFPFNS
jgi:hypothetical protein